MRGLAIALVAAAMGCVIAAGPAAAGGTLTPTGAHLVAGAQEIAGPSFAGKGIAWATPSHVGRDYDVRVVRDGTRHTEHVAVRTGGVDVDQAFAASAEQSALAVTARGCDRYCTGGPEVILSDVFAGATEQPLASVFCGAGQDPNSVDLDGSVLATLDHCAGGATVRDLSASPGTSARFFAAIGPARIVGPYLAVGTATRIVVYDWRSGQELYEVNRAALSLDISSDGVVTFSGADGELDWASRQEPMPHPIAAVRPPAQVRSYGSRVAVHSGSRFRVLERDGSQVGATSAGDALGFDFDGTRIVYGVHPCEASAVVTWDLKGASPAMPPGPCPNARLAGRTGVVDLSARTLTVPLRCPATPALGCSGEWYPRLAPSSSSTYTKLVALEPGQQRRVRFRLFRGQACAFARGHIRRVDLYLGPQGSRRHGARGSGRLVRLGHVRAVGRPRGCRR